MNKTLSISYCVILLATHVMPCYVLKGKFNHFQLFDIETFQEIWTNRKKRRSKALFVFEIEPFLLFQDVKITTSSPAKSKFGLLI
jgi:hypothetical protein